MHRRLRVLFSFALFFELSSYAAGPLTCEQLIEGAILRSLPINKAGIKSIPIFGPQKQILLSTFGENIAAFARDRQLVVYANGLSPAGIENYTISFDAPITSLSFTSTYRPILGETEVGILTLTSAKKVHLLKIDPQEILEGNSPVVASKSKEFSENLVAAESLLIEKEDDAVLRTFILYSGKVASLDWEFNSEKNELLDAEGFLELPSLNFTPQFMTSSCYKPVNGSQLAIGGNGRVWLAELEASGHLVHSKIFTIDPHLQSASILSWAPSEDPETPILQDCFLMGMADRNLIAYHLPTEGAATVIHRSLYTAPFEYLGARSMRANQFILTGFHSFQTTDSSVLGDPFFEIHHLITPNELLRERFNRFVYRAQ